jgi:hypothetical protein
VLVMPAPDTAHTCCRWLNADCRVSNFIDKFGSVRATVAVCATALLVCLASLVFFALTITAPPLVAFPGVVAIVCGGFVIFADAGLPCGTGSVRPLVWPP